jgi:tRNA 2-thiouridine synthesizing protein A
MDSIVLSNRSCYKSEKAIVEELSPDYYRSLASWSERWDETPPGIWTPDGRVLGFALDSRAVNRRRLRSGGRAAARVSPGMTTHEADETWDAGDLGCGELVLELRLRLGSMRPGQVMKLIALDSGAPADLPAWCRMTGHTLLSGQHPVYLIRREEK